MLYYKALQSGLSELPPANKQIRDQLYQEAQQCGWAALHARLAGIDPLSAQRIKSSDPQRIQRALEVFALTGQTLTTLWQQKSFFQPFRFINIGLVPQARALLHQRIAERFKLMLQQGLVDEVTKLYQRQDLHMDLPAIRSVGYRQVWQYLSGTLDWEQMQEKATIATRQLAKRQLLWLKNWKEIEFFQNDLPENPQRVLRHLKNLGINL